MRIEPRADGWWIRPPTGGGTRLFVDDAGWLTRWEGPPGAVEGPPVVREFRYDAGGLLTAMVAPGPGQPEERTWWHFEYDALGRLISDADPVAHAAGAAITLERVRHPDGAEEVIHRTPEGRETGFLTRAGRGGRTLSSRTRRGDDGREVQITEDLSGRTVVDRETGVRVEEGYGAHPFWGLALPQLRRRILEVPVGDRLFRREVTFEHHQNGDTEVFTTTEGERTWESRVQYLANGYHVEFTSPEGRRSEADFDALGRLIEARAGRLPRLALDWSAAYPDRVDAAHSIAEGDARTTEVEHLSPYAARLINAAGEQLEVFVDGRLRLERLRLPDGAEIGLEWDERDQLSALFPPDRPAHRFEGDARGLQTMSIPPAFSVDTPEDPTAYAYDLDGRPTCVEMPDERVIWHAYDDAGRLAAVHLYERAIAGHACPPPGDADVVIEHGYDADDRLLTATRDDGRHVAEIEARPDGLRPAETMVRVDGLPIGATQVDVGEDMRVQALEIAGLTLPIAHDADGLVLQVGDLRLHRTHPDSPGHDGGLGGVEGATFDWSGHRVETQYTFNARGEIGAKQVSLDGAPIYAQRFEARDAVSRLLEVRETVGDESIHSTYTYDVRGRLVEAISGDRISTYTYDANNNLTRRTIDAVEATGEVNDQDQLVEFAGERFVTNAMGQTEVIIHGVGRQTQLTYDVSGNLTRAITPDHRVDYLVDAADRRVGRRVDDGEWQYFLWFGDVLVAEVDADGAVTRRYFYGTRKTTPDAMIEIDPQTGDEAAYAVIHDHRGSVRLVVDMQSDEIVQRIDYDAFGRVLRDTQPGLQPFGFTGGLYDPLTGLTRMDARDYYAQAHRWTAKDPIGFAGGDANLYAYVGNDPINFVDPSGLAWEEDVANFFSGIGDTLTVGLTKRMRDGLGVGDLVDECSAEYAAGGWAADIGSLGAGALRAVGRRAFRRIGRPRPLSRGCRFGRNSFVEGTEVLTADGPQPIETLQPGDLVLTIGEAGPELRPVTDRFDGEADELVVATVRLDDGMTTELGGTAEHPIYVPSRGRWIELAELVEGDDLQGLGQPAWIEAVRRDRGRARVFNLEVEGTRSFFAGGVLVHNSIDACGSFRATGRANLRRLGLDDISLHGRSFNSGRKQLESAGFVLERTTATGRKVFTNPKTGAQVLYDSGGALAPGQKRHWHIVDRGGQKYSRSGRRVDSSEGSGHIPAR